AAAEAVSEQDGGTAALRAGGEVRGVDAHPVARGQGPVLAHHLGGRVLRSDGGPGAGAGEHDDGRRRGGPPSAAPAASCTGRQPDLSEVHPGTIKEAAAHSGGPQGDPGAHPRSYTGGWRTPDAVHRRGPVGGAGGAVGPGVAGCGVGAAGAGGRGAGAGAGTTEPRTAVGRSGAHAVVTRGPRQPTRRSRTPSSSKS